MPTIKVNPVSIALMAQQVKTASNNIEASLKNIAKVRKNLSNKKSSLQSDSALLALENKLIAHNSKLSKLENSLNQVINQFTNADKISSQGFKTLAWLMNAIIIAVLNPRETKTNLDMIDGLAFLDNPFGPTSPTPVNKMIVPERDNRNYNPVNQFIVTFDPQGGTTPQPSVIIDKVKRHYGRLPKPTRNGYNFKNWFTAKTGGKKVTATSKMENKENHTLYARWEGRKIKVTFEAKDGKLSSSAAKKTVIFGQAYGSLPTPNHNEKDSYAFNGWILRFNDTANSMCIEKKITKDTKCETAENHKLFATWGKKVEVTFDAGNGTVSPNKKTVIVGRKYGELPTPKHNEKDLYTFNGWFTKDGTDGTEVTEKTRYNASKPENHKLIALWENKNFELEWPVRNGKNKDGELVNSGRGKFGCPFGKHEYFPALREGDSEKVKKNKKCPKSHSTGEGHLGLDINASTGDIIAARSGIVSDVRRTDSGASGLYVEITHNKVIIDGIERTPKTFYAHLELDSIPSWIEKDKKINVGNKIGNIGTTGFSTGIHLHFGVRINDTPVNPEKYLKIKRS